MNENETTQGNKFNPLIIVAIVAVLAIVGFAMMRPKSTTTTNNAPAAGIQEESTEEPSAPASEEVTGMEEETTPSAEEEVQVISMEAGAFYYKPNTITVKQGQKVKIEMKSADMMHDFNIDELGVKSPITKAGETATVEFVADKKGTFEYYCSVGEHRKNGQVGTIIVE